MIDTVAELESPVEQTEAYKELLSRHGRKTGNIPPDLLIRHVLACIPADEWPTRVDAMDALVRRLESIRKDNLRVEARPGDGRLLGFYLTRRTGSPARPYRTVLHALSPIDARCNCPDFLKNSLGLCKHVLVVLEHLHARPRLLQQAQKEQEWGDRAATSTLCWNPIRPLTGIGDWLDRVHWNTDLEAARTRSSRFAQAARWFRSSADGSARLKSSFVDQPTRRLELVEDLLKLLPAAAAGSLHDPALRNLLENERRSLKERLAIALRPAEIRDAIKQLKRPLYPYQRAGVDRFLAAGKLLLADDMGLGKTAQAITCCHILRHSGRIRRGLIIAPAGLKPQWAREWASFTDLPVQVVDGPPEERQAAYSSRAAAFLIINYEQLLRDLETVRRWDPELVVLDEAQRIKNWATKTALSVKGLSPRYRLVLTGTPMENRIDELASVVEWVDDMALEPKWRLSSLHSIRSDGRHEVVGARNLDTIRDRLKHCMVRRVRQDVLDQLPSRTDTRVPVEMTEVQQAAHDDLIQPIAQIVQRSLKRPLTQVEFLKLMSYLTTQRIISNGMAQLQFEDLWPTIHKRRPDESTLQGLSAPKLSELRQLVRQLVIDQGRRIVVFSQWRRMLSLAQWAVSDLLGENGLRSGFFTGAEGQRRRTQNIVEFHDDPNFRILFTSDAGGVGLNLQHAANCVINIELPWNPAVLEQRIGRIYRLGQKLPIDVYNLVSEQGIESRIAALVGSKQAFFKGLFDGESDSVQFDQSSSFLAKVQKFYESEAIDQAASTAASADEDLDSSDADLDDSVADPFDDLIEAADESHDRAVAANGEAASAAPASRLETARPQVPASAPTTAATAVAAMPSAGEVRQFFSQLKVSRAPSGNVIIEAPEESASTLGALFEGIAALLHAAAKDKR
jgi:superfamily II DNA or RNA helicase